MCILDKNENPIQLNESKGIKFEMHQILLSFRTQFLAWFIGFMIAILTVFSNNIVENIKFSVNKANQRIKFYEELSSDLSEYIFIAEINIEFLEKGWTTEPSLSLNIREYNDSVTKLRKKEYVYLSWLKHFWKDKEVKLFSEIFQEIKSFDSVIHSLNDEFEKVNISKTSMKVEPTIGNEAAINMKKIFVPLREKIRKLLLESI